MIDSRRFDAAQSFPDFLNVVTVNADLWRAVYRRTRVPESFVSRVRSLPGRWHLAVLSEDWCGDAVNSVPVVAKLAELAGNVDLRLFPRDQNPDIMDAHLSGISRSIPVVVVLDERFRERGWWGPRPQALQQWVLGPGQALDKGDRYREIRTWYARDLGLSTLEEVVSLMERAARARGSDVGADAAD